MKQIEKIDLKKSPRVRAEISDEAVADYAYHYINKHRMPPPVLYEDSPNHYIVADGLHRITALMTLPPSPKEMWAFDVRKGTYQDCLKVALLANIENGLRRTADDKRVSIATTLKEFPDLSDGKISEIAAVNVKTVAIVRKELVEKGDIELTAQRTGSDGRTINVKPIATRKARKSNDKPKSKDGDSSEVSSTDEVPEEDTEQEEVLDETGVAVPEDCLALWGRRNSIKEMMSTLSAIKSEVKKGKESSDPLYYEVGNELLADLSVCRQGLTYALPSIVCPTCNGKMREKCQLCHGRGLISNHLYQTVPEKMRDIRERAAKKGVK